MRQDHAFTHITYSLSIITGGDRTPGQQAGFQLATLVATLVIAIVGGLLTGK